MIWGEISDVVFNEYWNCNLCYDVFHKYFVDDQILDGYGTCLRQINGNKTHGRPNVAILHLLIIDIPWYPGAGYNKRPIIVIYLHDSSHEAYHSDLLNIQMYIYVITRKWIVFYVYSILFTLAEPTLYHPRIWG